MKKESTIRKEDIDEVKGKRSEETLKKRQESFSKAEKIAHLGYWEWDITTNTLGWSDQVYRIYGLDPEKDIPTYETVIKTLTADGRECFIKAIDNSINNNAPFEGEYSLICPDRSIRYIHTIGEVIKDKDGKAISMFGVVQDITEQKKAREELLKFKLGIERSDEVIFITNNDGTIIYANPAFEKIYGYSREEALGKTPRIIKSGLLPSEGYRQFWDMLLAKKVVNGELINKTKDGNLLNIGGSANPILNDEGNIIGFLAIQRDITEAKQNEEKLRMFRRLIDQSNDAIFVNDPETGRILDVNEKATNSLGYKREELLNMRVTDLDVTLRDTFYWKEHVKEVKKRGHRILEGRLKRKDNSTFPVEANISFTAIGKIEYMIAVVRDITERKNAEKIKLENLRLEAADKTKSEFLTTMSHELRTPLNAVIGFSELLKMNASGNLNEKQLKYMNNILYGGKHLLNLIDDVLDLSKLESGKIDIYIEKISLPVTIDETCVLLKEEAARKNVIIKKEFEPQIEFIEADKKRVMQIFFNLLSNAVKFSKEEGGTVIVTTKREGDAVRISISDTGIGIQEEDQKRLFKEFEQLDSGITRKFGGTGLGLAISKKLVELHGGKIWAESTYGEGTTISFTMPIGTKKE